MWKQYVMEEDSFGDEWHREVMSQKYGRCTVIVWLSSSGYYQCVFTTKDDYKHGQTLEGCTDLEGAKEQALILAQAN
jgi:hypothetical protein